MEQETQMTGAEIEKAVAEYLASIGVTYSAAYRGVRKKALGGDRDMDQWTCDFACSARPREPESFDFFTGFGHRSKMSDTAAGRMAAQCLKGSHPNSIAWERAREAHCKPVAPTSATVLHSILLDSEACGQSFESWADDLGYDTDSRKAFDTYQACMKCGEQLARIITPAQREHLQTLLQDY